MASEAPVLCMVYAGPDERRFARTIVLFSIGVCLALAPFATVPLARVDAFIPAYQSALAICDLITAALLYGQFGITRSRAVLVLASGYLFCAVMAVAHAMTFPGLFSPTGLLGAGMQTTAWLYMFWHAGFPVAVLCYAFLKRPAGDTERVDTPGATVWAIVVVLALAAGLVALSTSGETALPAIMRDHHYTPAMIFVVTAVWSLSLLGLAVLLLRQPYTVLDVWLIAVLSAWLCDIALSAVLNAGRFDLGFYAGRLYGLMAASCVLIVLLLETIALYARLARSMEFERAEREQRLAELHSELTHVSRLNELGQMVSALSHEVNQPLAAITNYVRASQRLLRAGNAAMVETALGKAVEEAERASEVIRRMRDFIRKTDGVKRVEDLRAVLGESIALTLVAVERRDVAVESSVDPGASFALIDKIQVQQVLLNLIRNAVEASRDGRRPYMLLATAPYGDEMIEISVADRGPGLSADVRQRLFQPFVTTKSDGMGVGLSICRSIVEAHGGRIWADDNPGGGTIFHFTVPRATAEAPAILAPVLA